MTAAVWYAVPVVALAAGVLTARAEPHRRFVLADESIREVASRLASRETHRVVCEYMLTGGNAAAADIAKRKRGL